MRKTVDLSKWLSVSITVASLVTVFWVWPAWNSGSQTWYWGNTPRLPNNIMYRNTHPPSGSNAAFEFLGNFSASFMANEAANMMLTFGSDPWQYQIEWYRTPMNHDASATAGAAMDMVSFSLTIGRWSGMGMMRMYNAFFSAMGSGLPGSMGSPFSAMGSASMIPGITEKFSFMPGDSLGTMVMFMTSPTFPLTVYLANSASVTSPFSDPGYPGAVGAPTLSQWGILALTILLAMLSTFAMKRRIRIGRS